MANFDLNFDLQELSPLQLLQADIPDDLLPNYGQNVPVPVNIDAQATQMQQPCEPDESVRLENLSAANVNLQENPQEMEETSDDESDGRWKKATKKKIDKTAEASCRPNTHYQTKWAVKVFKGKAPLTFLCVIC